MKRDAVITEAYKIFGEGRTFTSVDVAEVLNIRRNDSGLLNVMSFLSKTPYVEVDRSHRPHKYLFIKKPDKVNEETKTETVNVAQLGQALKAKLENYQRKIDALSQENEILKAKVENLEKYLKALYALLLL